MKNSMKHALPCLLGLMAFGAQAVVSGFPRPESRWDFDHDRVEERLVAGATPTAAWVVEHWNEVRKTWEKAGYELPEGIPVQMPGESDTGLRFVDLNGDGFTDLLSGATADEELYGFLSAGL